MSPFISDTRSTAVCEVNHTNGARFSSSLRCMLVAHFLTPPLNFHRLARFSSRSRSSSSSSLCAHPCSCISSSSPCRRTVRVYERCVRVSVCEGELRVPLCCCSLPLPLGVCCGRGRQRRGGEERRAVDLVDRRESATPRLHASHALHCCTRSVALSRLLLFGTAAATINNK